MANVAGQFGLISQLAVNLAGASNTIQNPGPLRIYLANVDWTTLASAGSQSLHPSLFPALQQVYHRPS